MSGWLLDASALLAAEDPDDPHHPAAQRLVTGAAPLTTIDLVFWETANVALRSWRSPAKATRLRRLVATIDDAGRLVRADEPLVGLAAAIAEDHGLSAYDAAYVAGARRTDSTLVSCDIRDLVSRGLAVTPTDAVIA